MTDITNDDRAEMVRPFVEAFAAEHYWGSEYLHTIVQDLISDLGHLLDRGDSMAHIGVIEIDPEPPTFDALLMWAERNYDAEVGDEMADKEGP